MPNLCGEPLGFHKEPRLISKTKGIVIQWIKRLPLFWIAVLSCMTSVLVIVAVLQYRWTKQLSVASEARLASTLQPLMIGWHLDFYRELSAICVALQVGPDSGARGRLRRRAGAIATYFGKLAGLDPRGRRRSGVTPETGAE